MASDHATFAPFEAEDLDLSLAPTNTEGRPTKPTPNHLRAPALWYIAVRTGFRPDVKIRVGQRLPKRGVHCPFRDSVLRLAGMDPNDGSSLPRSLWGSSPVGLYKQVSYAVKMKTERWQEIRPHESKLPLYRGAFSDDVALTEYGVATAVKIHDQFNVPQPKTDCRGNVLIDPKTGDPIMERPYGNVTSVWLNAKCQEGLIEKMVDRLMQSPELGPEKATGHVLDHVQEFLSVSIRRDAFRSWLERGDAPRLGQLCTWAKRKAISAFRKRSRDCHSRERFGAMTQREREEGGPLIETMQASPYTVAITGEDTDETPMETNRVIVDPLTAQIMEHTVHGEIGMQRVYDAIRRMKAGNPDRFVALFDLMAAGHSVPEIGEAMGVSRNRAANLMAALRTAIREAECESREARIIIQYLKDEPYATIEDILEDIEGLESNVPSLMGELVARGRLAEDNGSYTVTEAGTMLMPVPDSDDFGARFAL